MGGLMLDKRLFSQYTRPLAPIPTTAQRSGSIATPIQCILFDVYGTLFISGSGGIGAQTAVEPPAEALLHRLLETHGILDSPAVVQRRMRQAIQDQHARLKNDGIDYPEVRIDEIWMQAAGFKSREEARKFALAYELITNPVFPMPHLKALLKIGRAKSVSMGIVSNAQFYTPLLFEWFLEQDLEALGFNRDLLIFSYQHGHGKPSRTLFDLARQRIEGLGLDPAAVLVVGNDRLNDIHPAQQAGFQTALFAGDARSLRLRENEPRCAGTVPDLVITDLIQLVDYLS